MVNLPGEEISSKSRLGFQLEQAFWFYEDFSRPASAGNPHSTEVSAASNATLPKLTLKAFAQKLLQRCPLEVLRPTLGNNPDHVKLVEEFYQYKSMVPTCGAIILNESLDKCLMVRGWTSRSTWGFPKGKINKDEPPSACAIREVFEETGFDISPLLHEDAFIQLEMRGNPIRLYLIPLVSEATPFATQTRREIGDIGWHLVKDLRFDRQGGAHRYFNVMPFIAPLKSWIKRFKGGGNAALTDYHAIPAPDAAVGGASHSDGRDSAKNQAAGLSEKGRVKILKKSSQFMASASADLKPQQRQVPDSTGSGMVDELLEPLGPAKTQPIEVDPICRHLIDRIQSHMSPLLNYSVDTNRLVSILNKYYP